MKRQGIKVITIQPEGNMDVRTKLYGNPSKTFHTEEKIRGSHITLSGNFIHLYTFYGCPADDEIFHWMWERFCCRHWTKSRRINKVIIDLMVITEVSQMINKVRRPDCLGSLMSANNLMAFHPRVIVTLLLQNQHCHPEQAYEILYKWLLQSKHTWMDPAVSH